MADDPRFSTLIKLMKMTTSSNDAEALVAMRKANALLKESFGGDWEALLRQKVTIINDPFEGMQAPPPKSYVNTAGQPRPMNPGRVPPRNKANRVGDLI